MARHVGSSDQHHVLGKAQVSQVCGFGQKEEVFPNRRLYFGEFLLEVLNEDVVQTPGKLLGFFANDFEALVQCFKILLRDKSPRFQSFLHVWILGCLAEFLK